MNIFIAERAEEPHGDFLGTELQDCTILIRTHAVLPSNSTKIRISEGAAFQMKSSHAT